MPGFKGLEGVIDLVSTRALEDSTYEPREPLSKGETTCNKGLR